MIHSRFLMLLSSLLISLNMFCKGDNSDSMELVKLNNGKMEMSVINYGARIQSLKVDGTDIVLGFDTLENYAKVK